MLLRRIARPLLAGIFISGGLDTLLNPGPRVEKAAPLVNRASDALPLDDPPPPSTVVQADAALKVVAGSLLASGYVPRLASAALAASLVPTTVVGHPFWSEKDPAARTAQRMHFMKNLGLLGGLLLASADTHGKPSLAWWARRAARRTAAATQYAAATTQHTAQQAAHTVADTAEELTDRVRSAIH